MDQAHLSTRPAPSWGRRVLISIVILVATVAALILLEFLFGQVAGSEFAPAQFRRRSFLYFEIPWVQLQISPVIRNDVSNDLEEHLRRQKLIKARPIDGRWDVVLSGTGVAPAIGQARILCRYLDERDGQRKLRWLEWTREHPDLAAGFWPAVQQVAILEAYCLIPDLFELAATAKSASRFTGELDRLLTASYTALGNDYLDSGRPALALRYYAAALERDPESQSLQRRQAEAERQLATEAAPP
jgi:hypothetical protein